MQYRSKNSETIIITDFETITTQLHSTPFVTPETQLFKNKKHYSPLPIFTTKKSPIICILPSFGHTGIFMYCSENWISSI